MAKSAARSDWELDEVVYLRESGWSFKGIAGFLGVSEKRCEEALQEGRKPEVARRCGLFF